MPAVDAAQIPPDLLHYFIALGIGPQDRTGLYGPCGSCFDHALSASSIERRGTGKDQRDSVVRKINEAED